MLVDINLLPQREPRNFAAYILLFAMLIFLLIGAIFTYWQTTSLDQETRNTENELHVTTEILAIEKSKLAHSEATNEVEQLEKAIVWTKEQPVDVNYMMQELFKMLPARGFVQSFSLTNETITSTVQFDSSTDASYFLNLLLNTDWINDATLSGRSTSSVVDGEEESTDVLPRYIVDYTIDVNIDAVKEASPIREEDGGERP